MAARVRPGRKMTLEARAKELSLEYGGALKPEARDHVRRGFAVGYVAGWRARGRADRVTKAERVNADTIRFLIDLKAHTEAARKAAPWMKDTAEVASLRKRLAKIVERAKGRK